MNTIETEDMNEVLALQLLDIPESTRIEAIVSLTSSDSRCC